MICLDSKDYLKDKEKLDGLKKYLLEMSKISSKNFIEYKFRIWEEEIELNTKRIII